MKKLKHILIAALIISAVAPACKKGENDPFISLQSRKARMTGEWRVSSGSGTSFTYDGTIYTTGNTQKVRTIDYAFYRDGTYIINDVTDGKVEQTEGVWNFTGGVGKAKNRSQLALRVTKFIDDDGSIDLFDRDIIDRVYDIDELRSNKIVLKRQIQSTYSSGGTFNFEETWVLEPNY